jgi:N-acetylmuramic acid 6-phosphate etherase
MIKEFLGIDIGGTWIKGTLVNESFFNEPWDVRKAGLHTERIHSPLKENSDLSRFIDSLSELIDRLKPGSRRIAGIGISTGGIVNYQGTRVTKAATYLNVLKNDTWKTELERQLDCTAIIINDADAAAIGVAESGLLAGNRSVGIMPVGTGLGFSIWRNGRRWRPGKVLNLLGSIRTPSGSFNEIASASKIASEIPGKDLTSLFSRDSYRDARGQYVRDLADIINTAAIMYGLDEVMVCGGLADAVTRCGYPLEAELNSFLSVPQVELERPVHARVLPEGNSLQLIGAVTLAYGEYQARSKQLIKKYDTIKTEIPYREDLQLQDLSTSNLIGILWAAEQEAGEKLSMSLPLIGEVIDNISERVEKGGRIIYIGAGTSGRIAAMDAVEIPCTYGFPEDRIICLIAGGIADASIEIESDFEEDASSVPEMLLLNIQSNDVVIGISASGTAYYVQSGLAWGKQRGAYSVLLQSNPPEGAIPFCDITIPLYSGYEVVAGSTRMKSGTATKKVLNFISSSVMIKLGKVSGSYMIDLACINNKLIERAGEILKILYGIDKEEAQQKLKDHHMQLSQVIRALQTGRP